MSFFKRFWKFFGSTDTFLWIGFLSALVLIAGSFFMKKDPDTFLSLNSLTLQQWLITYGIAKLKVTFWFFPFLFLFMLIGVSSFVCAVNRFSFSMIKNYSFFIHFGFFVLLLGQLLIHATGTKSFGNILLKGKTIQLPDPFIKVKLKDIKVSFFKKNTRFMGMSNNAKDCIAILEIKDRGKVIEKRISLNDPAFYRGWIFFIYDFSPKNKMSNTYYINLLIKRDPALTVLIVGMIIFLIGIFMYLVNTLNKKGVELCASK